MGRLEGQRCLVTGGASGLGRAVVERFLAEGARVVVLDLNGDRLGELAARHAGRLVGVAGDVRSGDANDEAVARAVERFGGLDVLVANAGIWDYNTRLLDLDGARLDAAFDELFAVNVKGYLLAALAAAPALLDTAGTMVFTASNASFHVDGGGPLYTASKHAVVGLVRQLAFELAPTIRVNAVAPGAAATDLRGPRSLQLAERSISDLAMADGVSAVLPIGRLPEVHEYAAPYVLLASRTEAATITGAVISADGGVGVRGFAQASGRPLDRRPGPSAAPAATHHGGR